MNTKSNWLTKTEAAAHLRIHPRTLLNWTNSGKIKGHRLSGTIRTTWLWREEDLDGALTCGGIVGNAISGEERAPVREEQRRRGIRKAAVAA